jgi:hypothetical protein
MEPTAKPQTASVAVSEPVDPVLKVFTGDPHRAFKPEDLVRLFKPAAVRDPQKLAEAAAEIKASCNKLIESGQVSEIAPGLYKARLFFDPEHRIEHAFIGGFGNTTYSFVSPLFRLNIGVLSVYFVKDQRKADWILTVRDTTIGKDYCLPQRLCDGTYVIGTRPPKPGEEHHLQIQGRYIDPEHVTLTISGDKTQIEDHKTLNGTRVDHLTDKGLAEYQELAKRFINQTDRTEQSNVVKRGRFVLEELLKHHQNFEATFFSTAVDSVVING